MIRARAQARARCPSRPPSYHTRGPKSTGLFARRRLSTRRAPARSLRRGRAPGQSSPAARSAQCGQLAEQWEALGVERRSIRVLGAGLASAVASGIAAGASPVRAPAESPGRRPARSCAGRGREHAVFGLRGEPRCAPSESGTRLGRYCRTCRVASPVAVAGTAAARPACEPESSLQSALQSRAARRCARGTDTEAERGSRFSASSRWMALPCLAQEERALSARSSASATTSRVPRRRSARSRSAGLPKLRARRPPPAALRWYMASRTCAVVTGCPRLRARRSACDNSPLSPSLSPDSNPALGRQVFGRLSRFLYKAAGSACTYTSSCRMSKPARFRPCSWSPQRALFLDRASPRCARR